MQVVLVIVIAWCAYLYYQLEQWSIQYVFIIINRLITVYKSVTVSSTLILQATFLTICYMFPFFSCTCFILYFVPIIMFFQIEESKEMFRSLDDDSQAM